MVRRSPLFCIFYLFGSCYVNVKIDCLVFVFIRINNKLLNHVHVRKSKHVAGLGNSDKLRSGTGNIFLGKFYIDGVANPIISTLYYYNGHGQLLPDGKHFS